MNYKIVIYTIGRIIQIIGVLMLLPAVVGGALGEKATLSLASVAVGAIVIGGFLHRRKPEKSQIRAKEGFVITAVTWLVMSIVGAIPFFASGEIASFTDAVFETASGFTTTGASILTDIEGMSKSLLLWRSFTHWIGGMGILVFMIAFVPSSADEMNIMKAESPGPSVEKMVPRVRETAFILYAIYTCMTVAMIIALCIAGMPIFDSVCLSFGTAGTGGFGVLSDSIASYSRVCQTIITIGMVLFGVNFNVYYLILMKKFKDLIHCEEVIIYLVIYTVASIAVGVSTLNGLVSFAGWDGVLGFDQIGDALHHSFFQVASVMTTTGYATVDFDQWSTLPKAIMVIIMFIGACAGSTGGGMKVSRWILYVKQVRRELLSYIHPNSVNRIRLDGKVVDDSTLRTTNVYLMAYVFVFMISFLLILIDGFDITSSFTSVVATINNIGPGLGVVGPCGGFSEFSILSKWVFIFDMIAGRLEVIPVLILLAPNTWRRK